MSISANSRCASTAFHCAGGMSMGAATGARKVQVPQPSSSNARPRSSLAASEQVMIIVTGDRWLGIGDDVDVDGCLLLLMVVMMMVADNRWWLMGWLCGWGNSRDIQKLAPGPCQPCAKEIEWRLCEIFVQKGIQVVLRPRYYFVDFVIINPRNGSNPWLLTDLGYRKVRHILYLGKDGK